MKYSFLITLAFVVCSVVSAQQTPQYSQYMYNMSTVNPGYVFDQSDVISTGLLYRKQWVNIDGSPSSANVFLNFPVGEKIELTLNYVNDQIGDAIAIKNDYVNVDFAYKTQLSKSLHLAYGLKLGIDSFRVNSLGSNVSDDPAFGETTSELQLNIGAGAFLYADNFYLGISSPNLLPNEAELGSIGVSENSLHLFGIVGYVYEISDVVTLKPSAVVKQVVGAPISFDISANSLLYNRFEAGVSYRYQESISALAGFRITPDLRIGYAYDFGINDLNNLSTGSHEIMLLFDFDLLKTSKNYSSPRFY